MAWGAAGLSIVAVIALIGWALESRQERRQRDQARAWREVRAAHAPRDTDCGLSLEALALYAEAAAAIQREAREDFTFGELTLERHRRRHERRRRRWGS